jgi:hypothetical protein
MAARSARAAGTISAHFASELVLEEGHVVLMARLRRQQLGGLDHPPAILQGIKTRLVGRLVGVPGRRRGGSRAVVVRPAHHPIVEGGRGKVQNQHLLA